MAKRRLGLLGPIIVLVGAAAAGAAIWYMLAAKPEPGEVIDRFALDPQTELVVRKEAGGTRSFLELHERGAMKWQALIPPYAGAKGRPAVAWSDQAVTVRVDRDSGRAEVFAFARANARKIGALRLAPDKEPIKIHASGPITLTDHQRSFELLGGADWNLLIAIDLATGQGAWKAELGKTSVTDAGVAAGRVWIEQGGQRRSFDAMTGREESVTKPLN